MGPFFPRSLLRGGPDPVLGSQAEELRAQLRLLEDAKDGLRRELLETQRKVRDSQEGREAQRQEASELRRSLSEGAKEREALRHSNEELRAAVRRAESERIRCGPGSFTQPCPRPGEVVQVEILWPLSTACLLRGSF